MTVGFARARRRPPGLAAGAGLALVASVAAWIVLDRALAAGRGLDATDESLYLLAADPPSRTASWNVPWGWHTRPLYVLSGSDIARFRTAGALVLVASAALVGVMAIRASAPRPARWSTVGAALVGASGALLIYGDLLRVPAYNWVNLVGVNIALLGGLGSLARDDGGGSSGRRWDGWLAICAFGLFVTIPAKPSTAPMLVVGFGAAFAVVLPRRAALIRALVLLAWCVAWVLAAIVTGVWPRSLGRTLARTMSLPALDDRQTVSSAVGEFVTLPNRLGESISDLPLAAAVLLLAALAGVLVAATRLSPRLAKVVGALVVGLGVVAGLHVAAVPLPGFTRERPVQRFALATTTTGALIVVVAAVGYALVHRRSSRAGDRRSSSRPVAAVPALLTLATFVFAFGSANTPYRQASMAAGLLLVAAWVLIVSGADNDWSARAGAALVLAFTLALVTVTLRESRMHPYRSAPVDEQTVPLEITPGGARLMVQADLAAQVSSVRSMAAAAGWQPGTPMLGLTYRWASLLPYSLGAEVPDSLMLTLFGYPGSLEFARYNVEDLDRSRWSGAWILISDRATVGVDGQAQVDAVRDMLAARLGRRFPDDYSLVGQVGAVQLWRPVES